MATTTIGFEDKLWGSANILRNKLNAADYRKVVTGLIFLKYVSDAFEQRYQELVDEGEGFEEDKDEYERKNVFFIPEKSRWSYVSKFAQDEENGVILDNAMREIENENKKLKNVLPKIFASSDIDKIALGEVVNLFTNINMYSQDDEKDLLGRTYEYFIAKFAENEGKKGGEFYTPTSIVKLIVEILKPYNGRVYDPAMGSGGMFVQSFKFIENHTGNRNHLSVYGQESNPDTWKMAKMNMAIRGIDADFGPSHADSFTNDLHRTLKADFIMANPPFNIKNWGADKLQEDYRWGFGTPPNGNANYAWIQHMISHLAPNGKIGLVLANGSLSSQTNNEGQIRRNIIEHDLIEGIIALPANLFYSVTIPCCLWFITKGKKQPRKTIFIDARNMGHMVSRTHREFSVEDTQKIAQTFEAFQKGTFVEEKGFSAVVTTEDIANQDYILTPGRYVGLQEIEVDGEPFEEKMARLTTELSDLFKQSDELQEKIRKALGGIGYEI